MVTVAFFVMFGFFFLMTQYLQFARGYSPLEAGLATLPLALTFVAVSPRSAALAERYGAPQVMALGLGIVAVGFGVMTLLTTDTPYLVIAAGFVLLGAGMSITAAPATGEIMASVPLSKAGVGSAVNDTTRELGGALGIALLGSIATSAYRSSVELGGLGLPAGARAGAEESIGAASAVAASVPGGGQVVAHAASAFTDAFTFTNTVALGIALAAAASVLAFSRRRGSEPAVDDTIEDFDFDLVPVAAAEARE